MTSHPYSRLTPDLVLAAIDSTGCYTDGRLLPLNSFENRVYQAGQEEGPPLIAKFYRPERWSDAAILEEHAFALALAEDEIPAVPPLQIQHQTLFHYEGYRFALFRRQGGRTPEFDDPAVLEWLGRFLARIHDVGARSAYQCRLPLDRAHFGDAAQASVLASGLLPPELVSPYRDISTAALAAIDACWQRAGQPATLRLHGDCHPGNLLWTDGGPHFVDLDDSCTGPAVQDLWMLLGGERQEMSQKLGDLLAGYEQIRDFDLRELHLIEALRSLRMIHHAAWLARRWDDPAFPPAFPWFNTHAYWQEHIGALQEQLERMNEAPLWSATY
ncbi:serine/threonine protein kinase [Chitinilyticum piscinae]|uniref:Stress response kinase A n=1 Tax=Chitinilyticum piscinae TaxID=2866724 RepID=A0A8J7K257_9NEIS|nr:serine/threonine protein kinase [Chitinilyticum piscinae]MBE9610106.1 serine/threonine protein kinase [Chitinilyticum piscinae]